jgi:L-rhamnose-H+ transport protein
MHFVLLAGIAVILGGAMQGSFALPMSFVRSWQWENIWFVYSIVGLLVIPWAVAQATIPELGAIYSSVSITALAATVLFGFGWGVANVMFGLAVPRAGMALTFAIVLGMSASLGALIPLVVSSHERLLKPSGLFVLAGVALTLLGVFLLGYAARARERAEAKHETNIGVGLILAVLAGVFAPMLNFSFAFGSDIVKHAIVRGATPVKAVNAIWAVALAGGFLSNGGYSVMLLTRNHSWSRFLRNSVSSNWGLSALMGILWTSGIVLYGWGASLLGSLGPSVGWPVFQAMIVVTSSVIGFGMGEWKNAEARTVRIAGTGLAVLVAAIVLLSIGNRI